MRDLVNILVLTAVYGLYASGFTLVFGLFDVLNLAHAAVFAFGAVLTMAAASGLDVALPIAAGLGIAASALVGLVVERVAFRPIRYRSTSVWGRHIGPLITSLGAASILAGMSRIWFGINARHFPSRVLLDDPVALGSVTVRVADLVSIALLIVAFGALQVALARTRWGLEVRAVAQSPQTVPLFGVNVERRIMEVFALAAALGGVAGIVWGLQFNTASPATAVQMDVRGFAIIILGGMGSVPGAIVGAVFLAASEVLSVRFLPPGWQSLIAFLALFVMLLVRPQGILGRRIVPEKV